MALTREHGRYGKIMEVFFHQPIWQFLAKKRQLWRFLAKKRQCGDFQRDLGIFGQKAPRWRFPVKFGDFQPKSANVAISSEI